MVLGDIDGTMVVEGVARERLLICLAALAGQIQAEGGRALALKLDVDRPGGCGALHC